MTDAEKIAFVKSTTDETDDGVISAFLSIAADSIYHYADPYGSKPKEDVIDRYGSVQARAATYFLNKRGAEGQTSHSENGISRSYENAELPDSLLREITPICGVVK